MKNKPALSICIPTYNRASYLQKSLESIICQDGFEHIEVVISDNCSTDNTEKTGIFYMKKYENIKYFRNQENIIGANHPLALQRGTGMLRKLSNDTVSYRPGAIRNLIKLADKYKNTRPMLFFMNKKKRSEHSEILKIITSSEENTILDVFLQSVSYDITWISSIAVWEDDCRDMSVYDKYLDTNLGHVPFYIDLIAKHKDVIIFEDIIMKTAGLKKKNLSYGIYDTFYTNFLGLLDNYMNENKIHKNTWCYIRKDLLLNFFSFWTAQFEDNKSKYLSSGENLRELLEKSYGTEPYYNQFLKRLLKKKIHVRLSRIYHAFPELIANGLTYLKFTK